jgi:hypothetical protein
LAFSPFCQLTMGGDEADYLSQEHMDFKCPRLVSPRVSKSLSWTICLLVETAVRKPFYRRVNSNFLLTCKL